MWFPVQQVRKGLLVLWDRKVLLVLLQLFQVLPVLWDLKDKEVIKALKVFKDPKATKAHKVFKASWPESQIAEELQKDGNQYARRKTATGRCRVAG